MQSEGALTVVENTDDKGGEGEVVAEDEEVVTVEDEDLEVVQPTEEWQTLKPGLILKLLFLISRS